LTSKKNKQNKTQQMVMIPARIIKPPPFNASFRISKVLRYLASSGSSGSGTDVTAQNMAAIFNVAVSATTGFSLVGAIHLKRLEMWSPASPGATVSAEFHQGSTTFIGSPSVVVSDTSVGTAYPAYVSTKPPKNSLSGFCIDGNATSTGPVVTLTYPDDAVVDFHVDMVLLDSGVVGQSTTGAGMTAGVTYLKILGAGSLQPANYPGY
jgi:hypothetical protein